MALWLEVWLNEFSSGQISLYFLPPIEVGGWVPCLSRRKVTTCVCADNLSHTVGWFHVHKYPSTLSELAGCRGLVYTVRANQPAHHLCSLDGQGC